MFIVNTLKGVSLYGNVFIHLKQQFNSLRDVPNAQLAYVLLPEISLIYNLSYISVLQGSTYPTHL